MESAERYASWRDGSLREARERKRREPVDELELQAQWFAGAFGSQFRTTAGQEVRIIQFGVWNREAGPDFAEAAISIDGGPPLRGCIELDPDARDWEHHGHAANPAYEAVVLHVFTRTGSVEFFTRTLEHRSVPQVLLDLDAAEGEFALVPPAAKPGRCSGPLRTLPVEKVREVLHTAARYRLQRKAGALARMQEVHGTEEAIYQAIASALGYKSNKLPFLLLAQRLPLGLLAKAKEQVAGLLFGVSGFLNEADLRNFDTDTRTYLREVWDQWWPKRAELERLRLQSDLWSLGGQRPANHPQRRLGALVQLVHHWPKLAAIVRTGDLKRLRQFFIELSDPYWSHHYTLTSKATAKPLALVGETRVIDMLANIFFPLVISEEPTRWSQYTALRAPLSNRRAEVAALRLLGDDATRSELLGSVAVQQGLLQVYEDFCLQDATDCAQCRFPQQLATW